VICLTFDNLGAAAEGGPPDTDHPSLRTGLPRILALLADLGVPATFFVEGWNGEAHPDALRRICDAGHELGLHAWRHERWSELDPEREAALLARGVEALDSALGRPPRGFRPPGGRLTPASPELFPRHGIAWVSPQEGALAGLPGVPFSWARVEALALLPQLGGRAEPGDYFAGWLRGAEEHERSAPETPWVCVAHPFCAGVDPQWPHFERFARALHAQVGAASFRRLGEAV